MSQTNLHQHLVKDIPNIEEFRNAIKDINKMAKQSNSKWRLSIRYRKPKEGHKYGYGGNLRCENANAFSVYINDHRPYNQIPENIYRRELWGENHKLEEENKRLKHELKFYKNPYNEWRREEIEEEIFNVKEDMVGRFIEDDAKCSPLDDDQLISKYNQLLEALEYHARSND